MTKQLAHCAETMERSNSQSHKIILRCFLSLGDIVMLTAAVRDLHKRYPNRFLTDVRTVWPELWENNPHIVPLSESASDVRLIDCRYDLIHESNDTPHHFIYAFTHDLNAQLGLDIRPTAFKGDIYISEAEKAWCSQVHELTGEDTPFWIVIAGGKYDYTTKWWSAERYQKVIDHFEGRIQFVQVGAKGHHHPPLERVIDLRGQTNARELVRLVYHAQGVLCPVTGLMHLAAAVETKNSAPENRPCVVVAGGREPPHWEAYPHHQYLHTNGSLFCCDQGGCWKSRTVPLGDGSELDNRENLCANPVGDRPRCMDLITPEFVIRRIEMYFQGGALKYLTQAQYDAARSAVSLGESVAWAKPLLERRVYKERADQFIASIPSCPKGFRGRGIVICAGGTTSFTNAWVCINMLRRSGCTLPVELWHIGDQELDERMKRLISPFGVECVDALKTHKPGNERTLNGWTLKPLAVLHSEFNQILLLDADNVPLINPEYLFETAEFRQHGAVFWPDVQKLSPESPIWGICGVTYQDEPEFESGQMLIDKERTWKALALTLWYNEHSDFYYQHVHGDKDTFHMAFRKLSMPYAMPGRPVALLDGAMCQHDFQGRRVFQHRNLDKWNLRLRPRRIKGFLLHNVCSRFLKSLRKTWDGRLNKTSLHFVDNQTRDLIERLVSRRYELHVLGAYRTQIVFCSDGRIEYAKIEHEPSWKISHQQGRQHLEMYSRNHMIAELTQETNGVWQGVHQVDGRRITLSPLRKNRTRPIEGGNFIWLRATINGYTGYGLHAIQIISDLSRLGYDVRVLPVCLDERFATVPSHICKRLCYDEGAAKWELLLHPPTYRPRSGKRTAYFTMWESSGLTEATVQRLNEAQCVIVPCKWNAECFAKAGVTRRIHLVPLGINTKIFKYSPARLDGPCIFGTGGRRAHGGVRKGVDQVLAAFSEAFPTEDDVRLTVKIFQDCEIPKVNDPRVVVIRDFLTQQEMAKWFRSLTCFVSAARSEGWGLMQQQALATGRPLISVAYGGVTEFFNSEFGYVIEHRLVPAEAHYENCGCWAEPLHESLIENMKQVYANREEAAALGKKGAGAVAEFTWEKSNQNLLQILQAEGMVS